MFSSNSYFFEQNDQNFAAFSLSYSSNKNDKEEEVTCKKLEKEEGRKEGSMYLVTGDSASVR